jgi:ubiquinone/menaquinone biosynthesis C-methylase UbiE
MRADLDRSSRALGNYAVVAERIASAAEALVERAGVEPGMEVLDVACGTGNVVLPAARAGARVTGLDPVPELLDVARERIADSSVEADFVQGDPEDLPFEDRSFDRVLSAFGHMFAPSHERAASELVRVCRPSGAIGLCCWTPEGTGGKLLEVVGQGDPALWGSEDHARRLLEDQVRQLDFERRAVTFDAESPEAWVAFLEDSLGRRDEARAELVRLFSNANEANDGTLRFDQEYLLVVARV